MLDTMRDQSFQEGFSLTAYNTYAWEVKVNAGRVCAAKDD